MGTALPDVLPRVSVIVPCYNAAGSIARLVTAIRAQDVPAELIFVDDGSTDATVDTLRTLTDREPWARVLVLETNRGRAAARNAGIAEATGDVLLFLDDDMEPEPGFVRAHAEAYQQPSVVGVVSTPVLQGLEQGDPYHDYLAARATTARVASLQPVPFRNFIIGYTSVRAEAMRAVGGFDDRFTYGEDIDLAYRLAQRFPEGLYVSPSAVVHHYNHGSLADRISKLRTFGRDNLPLLLDKHPDIAEPANLDFVGTPGTLRGALKRTALRFVSSAWLRRNVRRIPPALRFVGLRYLMASEIADAYRESRMSAR